MPSRKTDIIDLSTIQVKSIKRKELNIEDIANKKLIQVLRQLSELTLIGQKIFEAIEDECKDIYHRTSGLKVKVKRCQNIVDGLNAKTVEIPVSSLTCGQTNAEECYRSSKLRELQLLKRESRPFYVLYRYGLAQGPSPPVQPHPFSDNCYLVDDDRPCSSPESEDSLSSGSRTSSHNGQISKIVEEAHNQTSTVVPIDVSGNTLKRMAALRRSLIHVDFLRKKKKKDNKRRNTVSEVDSKSINKAMKEVTSKTQRLSIPCSTDELQNGNCDYSSTIVENECNVNETLPQNNSRRPYILISHAMEENNNSHYTKSECDSDQTVIDDAERQLANIQIRNSNRNINTVLVYRQPSYIRKQENEQLINQQHRQRENSIDEVRTFTNRQKKSRSHLPISTLSAAMTVAVKMRENMALSKTEDLHSSSGNWSGSSSGRTSSDSDDIKPALAAISRDSLLSDSTTISNTDQYRSEGDETTVSASETEPKCMTDSTVASSEKLCELTNYDEQQSIGTSMNGERASTDGEYTFESDDDVSVCSDFDYQRYTSSASLSTASNESLNSILSRTITDLSASTDTLISEVKLPVLPLPPAQHLSNQISTPCSIDDVPKLHVSPNPHTIIGKGGKKYLPVQHNRVPEPKQKIKHTTPKTLSTDPRSPKTLLSNLIQKKLKCSQSQPENLKPKAQLKEMRFRPINMYGDNINYNHNVTVAANNQKLPSPEKPKHIMRSFLQDDNHAPVVTYTKFNENLPSQNNQVSEQFVISDKTSNYPLETAYNGTFPLEASYSSRRGPCGNVPSKYSPYIRVLPQQQELNTFNQSKYPEAAINDRHSQTPSKYEQHYHHYYNHECPHYISNLSHTSNPDDFLQTHVPGAHVILDANGYAVHSTSSLDRRQYNIKGRSLSPYSGYDYTETQEPLCPYIKKGPGGKASVVPHSNGNTSNHYTTSQNSSQMTVNRGGQINQDTEVISQYGSLPRHATVHRSNNINVHKNLDTYIQQYGPPPENPSTCRVESINSCNNSLLTRENVREHSQRIKFVNVPLPQDICAVSQSPGSPHKAKSYTDFTNYKTDEEEKQSAMSVEDLFTIIHRSKKKMNIKTESDISVTPTSSRSSSPSFHHQTYTSPKSGVAETGFLSPRTPSNLAITRDRRSWAGFTSVPDRKSLASDRMGPNKPTSMREFKLLLLQTRTGVQGQGKRPSAAEQLRITSPTNGTLPSSNLTHSSSGSLPSSPMQNISMYNFFDGHMTVPLKRSHRSRGLQQTKYAMYPPILEDCLEEVDNSADIAGTTIKCPKSTLDSEHTNNYNSSKHPISKTEQKVQYGRSSMWV